MDSDNDDYNNDKDDDDYDDDEMIKTKERKRKRNSNKQMLNSSPLSSNPTKMKRRNEGIGWDKHKSQSRDDASSVDSSMVEEMEDSSSHSTLEAQKKGKSKQRKICNSRR